MPLHPYLGVNCLTCCAAVASSQVLYYFNRKNGVPKDLWHSISISSLNSDNTVTLSKSNYNSNSSRWGAMPLSSSGSHTDYVSYLMLDIGERISVHYDPYFSYVVAGSNYTIPNLSGCGIVSSYSSYSFGTVESDLLNQKPVIVSATTSSGGGHIWVIDGCKDYSKHYYTITTYYCIHPDEIINYSNIAARYTYDEMMSLFPNAYNGMTEVHVTDDIHQSLHMNWGYDGSSDGYYNMINTNDWYCSFNSSNFLYNRNINYSISTTQMY